MLVTYLTNKASKAPGGWYTFNYDSGVRARQADFQGDMDDLIALGRTISKESGREVRLLLHEGHRGRHRIVAIFNSSGGVRR